MTTQSPRSVHFVLSTHWDREWYEPFQWYRYRLVQLLDRVIDGIESGRLKGPFQTDGQAIILKDYLEVRPERRGVVEQYVREGKFVVGPWYVLPDEFLISGESHIRNLRLGRETARRFGAEPSQAGFVCDLFGHISQLPQIFAGFGIETAFLWRGVNLDGRRQAVWTGADGSELVCFRFGDFGYGEYAHHVRRGHEPEKAFDAEECRRELDGFLAQEARESEIDALLLFDGCDHQEWDEKAYNVLLERMADAGGAYAVRHTSLDEFQKDLLAQRDRITARLSGELREPGKTPGKGAHMIPGVLSSRVWIKQANAECQDLLCQWAEPLSTFASIQIGLEYPQGFLDVAWETLIQNHPHDSICGCSVDTVHEDMKFRFSQVRQIGERLTLEAMRRVTANVKGEVGEGEVRLAVFNPLPVAMDRTVEITVDTPADWPQFAEFFGYEKKPAFKLFGPDGSEIAYQRVGQSNNRVRRRILDTKFPQALHANEVRVSLPLSIPAMGYATLTARKVDSGPTRYPEDKGLAVSHRAMENELLRVEIEGNGTVTLTDKRTGAVYTELLTFEDCADIGDGWYHGVALNDQVFLSTGCPADIALVENGPNVTAFRVRTTMRLPARFGDQGKTWRRVEDFVELPIDTVLRLRPGQDYVEVETTVDNTVRDHRLRVLFPSGAKTDAYITDTPFDVVERTVPLRADNHEYFELEVETRPQQSFTAVADGSRGLAVVSTGLMESCVRDLEDRPIALTLLRGTYRTVLTDGEPNGEIPGKHTFRLLIMPLDGQPDRTRLLQLGQAVAGGLRTIHLRTVDVREYSTGTSLPPVAGLFELEGDAVLTSARQVGDGIEVRLFNPWPEEREAVLRGSAGSALDRQFRAAQKVDFESRPVGERLPLKDNAVHCRLRAKEIATLRLQ